MHTHFVVHSAEVSTSNAGASAGLSQPQLVQDALDNLGSPTQAKVSDRDLGRRELPATSRNHDWQHTTAAKENWSS